MSINLFIDILTNGYKSFLSLFDKFIKKTICQLTGTIAMRSLLNALFDNIFSKVKAKFKFYIVPHVEKLILEFIQAISAMPCLVLAFLCIFAAYLLHFYTDSAICNEFRFVSAIYIYMYINYIYPEIKKEYPSLVKQGSGCKIPLRSKGSTIIG